MPNYQNGYIYKIWSPQTKEIYIGSSTTKPRQRLYDHKSKYKLFLEGKIKYCSYSSLIIIYLDCKIEIIEKYPCNSRAELEKREGEIQRETECCNKNIAGRTLGKYKEENKEELEKIRKKYMKEWDSKNREKRKGYRVKYKETKSIYNKKYRENHKEYQKEYQKEYRQRKEKEKEKSNIEFLKIKIIKKG